MSRLLRTAAPAALAFAAVCGLASAASAQSYSRLVVFGDSLSDNGNLYAASFNTQPTSPPYFQGRFSNGPVFTELLGFNAGRSAAGAPVTGSINYAYGGARTDNSAGLPPGMRRQLSTYQTAGGTFGANDLVSVLGGANNIFQALPAAAVSASPQAAIQPVATSAAADINFMVNTIAGAGAGTILVTNLPKLSLTPQFRTSPAAPLADFAVTTFNGALSTGLFATAAARPGTNIILMDLYKIGDVIAGSPSSFGLTNTSDACFNGVTVCATPSTYFYWDGVHPTAAGHALLATLAEDYLYYGDAGAKTALQGETAMRFREDMLDASSEGMSGAHGWEAGTGLTFGVLYDSTDFDARGLVPEAESQGWGFRGGLVWSPSATWRASLSASLRNAEVTSPGQTFDVESYAIDAALGWRSGDVFANVAAGGGVDDYEDITRLTALAPIVHTGETQGSSFGARAQAGIWFGGDSFRISPRAAITWTSSEVEGYYEQGVAAQYQYEDRTVTATTAEATVRAETGMGGMSVFVEGGYRDDLDDGSDAVGTSIAGSPSQVLYREIESPFGGHMIAAAGIEGDWAGMKVAFGYRGRFGEHADSHQGGIQVTIPLP
ncbi:MAG TPA: SGNH/GDSL hydrolase family protein [Brevundimonas sp.]|jgi:outer membrane lipase/esterase|uniref:SGNH/GDSL hydrolase family protein n=1 Tax=Brevundimonas sp. TaxID=1871086 RepID=UPI002DE665F4|nr:SGNH/GDSL hydrolase family protein [Brevundimonas sp.]